MPPRPRPPRRTPRSVVWRRRLVALGVLVAGFAIAWVAVASVGGKDKTRRRRPRWPPPPKPFRIVFPEGFTREQMAARVTAVSQIAKRERGKRVRLKAKTYLAATANPRRQPGFGTKAYPLEGFLFPATYDFTARETSPQLIAAQLKAFRANWAKVNLAYARSKNLTPVRRADDRLDDREGDARARGAPARLGGDLQPAARADGPRHRRDHCATGCTCRRRSRSHQSELAQATTRTTRATRTSPA